MLKPLFLFLALWSSSLAFGSASRVLDGQTITNNGQVLKLPTGPDTLIGVATLLPPAVQTFNSGSGTYGLSYYFFVSSANATAGATYTNNGQTFTVTNTISGATLLLVTSTGAPATSGTLTKATGTGDSTISFSSFRAPVKLRILAAGGGGAGQGGGLSPANGSDGNTTTFGPISCTGGPGGGSSSSPGDCSLSAPAYGIHFQGGIGNASALNGAITLTTYQLGGAGGANAFGGGGPAGDATGAGGNGAPNTGAGGGGGGGFVAQALNQGGYGGSAGGYTQAIIPNPAATYSFSIAASQTGGAAGGAAGSQGGNSANGSANVFEEFQ